jgi:DNA-binding response OmpR family regulator
VNKVGMTVPQRMRHSCTINGSEVYLGRNLAAFLERLLLGHPDCSVSRNELWETLWGDDHDGGPLWANQIIHVYATTLRQLGIQVECFRGFGWRIPRDARGPRVRDRIVIAPKERRKRDYLLIRRSYALAA